MKSQLYWFLPLEPDIEFIGTTNLEGAEPTIEHMTAITQEVEEAGLDGLLVHTGYTVYHDSWIAASAVMARTNHARLIVAVRPNQYHPAILAKMAATLEYLFPGRLELNVVTGGNSDDKMFGNFDSREERYQRVREWFEIFNGLWRADEPFTYQGKLFQVEESWLNPEPGGKPRIFFSGASPEAQKLALEYADTYLLYGAPPAQVKQQIDELTSLAKNRSIPAFGLRVHIIVRPTEEEAWQAADRLISRLDPQISQFIASQPHVQTLTQTFGQTLTRQELVLGPNLWAGVGLGRFGVATALVGNPSQIAQRLAEYEACGISRFILSGYPKLAEAHRFGELVMPLLRSARY